MFNKFFILFAAILLTACEPDIYPQMACLPECPDRKKVHKEVDKVRQLFRPHIKDPNWGGWVIEFSDHDAIIDGRRILGATFHFGQRIWIWYPYECETKGVCPGVLEWELSLVQLAKILPNSSEADKIEYYQNNIESKK